MGTTRNGDGVVLASEKETEEECDVGLGLRMQQPNNNDYSRKKMLMSMPPPHHHHPYYYHHHHQQHLVSPSFASSDGDYGGGVGVGGALFSSTASNHLACVTGEHVVHEGSSLVSPGSDSSSSATATAASALAFHSSGKMAASATANEKVAFTATQWQELERQTTILKYMMASVPVPSELLSSVSKSLPTPAHSNRSSDPEPWRCRRTDGKKWRCSRDVAPHQKYCERHSHKNRPRSRKPVELQAERNSSSSNNNNNNNSPSPTTNTHSLNSCRNPRFSTHQTQQNLSSVFPTTLASAYEQPRCLEWFMKGETISSNQAEYQHSMHASSNRVDPFHLKQSSHVPLSVYSDYAIASPQELHETRHFIDAWSTCHHRNDNGTVDEVSNSRASAASNKKVPVSSLSLTMCGIGESESLEMGMGLMGGGEREKSADLRPHWMMMSPGGGSWMGSAPGGPLAEALCLGTANVSSAKAYDVSPRGCSSVTTTGSRSSSKDEGQELNLIG